MTNRRKQDIDYVKAILQAGSFIGATSILHLTQPAISQCIAKIEKEFGIQIFNRNVRPVTLTNEGRYWLEVEEQIETIRDRRQMYFSDLQEKVVGKLRIGTNQCRTATVLADVLPSFAHKYPDVQLELIEDGIKTLGSRVLKGDMDFCLTLESFVTDEMDSRVLMNENLLLAVPPQHRLAARANAYTAEHPGNFLPISFEEVAKEQFVLLKRGLKMHDYFFDLCHKYGTEPHIMMLTESVTTILELVSKGLCCGIVPDSIVLYKRQEPSPGFYSLQHEFPVNRVVAAWGKNLYLAKSARLMIDMIVENQKRIEANRLSSISNLHPASAATALGSFIE